LGGEEHSERLGEGLPVGALGQVDNYFTSMCSGSEEGSYLRLIDVCIPQLIDLELGGGEHEQCLGEGLAVGALRQVDNYFTEMCSGSEAGSY